ncbi:methanol dehydrogenase [cytochrome c] subunit [Methyloligella solikamskensis]|uniref:Methanol dehydrogenase [cytochrome c] subunit 2 n=1 Tax=Methyloligella solikamskensis TaxID=1177756 RepID=A0ABW3JBZ1_9HYPH
MTAKTKLTGVVLAAAAALTMSTAGALAYDGTNCKAPGNCWEPKPGYPEKVEGSKYDPKHDPKELAKQSNSITEMEERNAKRTAHFKETGEWVYDVSKLD